METTDGFFVEQSIGGQEAAILGEIGDSFERRIEAEARLGDGIPIAREPILGREAKLAALREEAANLGIPMSATLAVGDGANDLAMIEAAGLGVAYRAKPIVAAQAHAKVDHTDLTSLLYFQGYRADEFVTD